MEFEVRTEDGTLHGPMSLETLATKVEERAIKGSDIAVEVGQKEQNSVQFWLDQNAITRRDQSEALLNIQTLRDTCLGQLTYKEKVFDSGVPARLLAKRLFTSYLSSFRFDWVECDGRIEFWQPPEPTMEEQHATVCAVFVEQAGNRLKVTFGTVGFVRQTLKAALESRRDSLVTAASATVILGPTVGVVAGLANTALGAGVALVNKALEHGLWTKANEILVVQAKRYPYTPEATPVPVGSILERMEQLVRLRDAGALQPDEFERLKTELMAPTAVDPVESKAPDAPVFSQEMKLIKLAPTSEEIEAKERRSKGARGPQSGCFRGCLGLVMSCILVLFLIGFPAACAAMSEGRGHDAMSMVMGSSFVLITAIALYIQWKRKHPEGMVLQFLGLDYWIR